MSREVRRVPLDFAWPLNQTWEGYLRPANLIEQPCPSCDRTGYSTFAKHLYDLWYGKVPGFRPEQNGSTPFTWQTPEVLAFATRSVDRTPDFFITDPWTSLIYGGPTREAAIEREASRLAALWNESWMHHMSQADVDALDAGEHLRDYTHDYDRDRDPRWQRRDPQPPLDAATVNRWTLTTFNWSGQGHYAIEARCQAAGQETLCGTCHGEGHIEAYPGQGADADAWTATEPPTGDGWQLWETVSEGSPITPVFATDEQLVMHLTSSGYRDPLTRVQAEALVRDGWAPSGIGTGDGQWVDADRVPAYLDERAANADA